MLDLQYCVSFRCQQSDFYFSVLFSIIFHYSLLQNIQYSSLCYTVSPCCLSILYVVLCMCYSQIPNLSLPATFPLW